MEFKITFYDKKGKNKDTTVVPGNNILDAIASVYDTYGFVNITKIKRQR